MPKMEDQGYPYEWVLSNSGFYLNDNRLRFSDGRDIEQPQQASLSHYIYREYYPWLVKIASYNSLNKGI